MKSKKTKAALFNFICFAVLFLGSRFLIFDHLKVYYIFKIMLAFLTAGILSPKFLVNKNELWVKFPLKSKPKKL